MSTTITTTTSLLWIALLT